MNRRGRGKVFCLGWALVAWAVSMAHAAEHRSCQKIVLEGEVKAGQEWKAAFGEGWVFRVMPIHGGQPAGGGSYSGWDLVVDREPAAGFPDALLVATPPYNSINEHEVGTTFGLRAQDAMGWNPRSFRFFTSPAAFRESQKLFHVLNAPSGGARPDAAASQAARRLVELEATSSAGEFTILDAQLTPGISDAAPYAENWALASAKTPHSNEPASAGNSTALGTLHWMRFSITLWLSENWPAPQAIHAKRTVCLE